MAQSKLMSSIESTANLIVGALVALCLQAIVFPWFGFDPSFDQNLAICLIFTAVSWVRSYSVRRLFNWLHTKET